MEQDFKGRIIGECGYERFASSCKTSPGGGLMDG